MALIYRLSNLSRSTIPTDPWINLDGRLNAPSGGTIPHPHALDTNQATNEFGRAYVVRPPWQVAGVDYPIGPHGSTVFKNPEAGGDPTPAGWNFDRVGRVATATANNAVLDGWDMTAGWGIALGDPSLGSWDDAVVTNNKITVGNAGYLFKQQGAGNGLNSGNGLTVKYNILDGLNAVPSNINAVGVPYIFQYNWMKNFQGDFFDIGPAPSYYPQNRSLLDVRFNCIENNGSGVGHNDLIQTFWIGPNQMIRFGSALVSGNSISGTVNIGAGAQSWGPISFTTDDLTTRILISNAINTAANNVNFAIGPTTNLFEIISLYAPAAYTITMSITGGPSQPTFTIAEYQGQYNSQVVDFNLWITSINISTEGTDGIDYAGQTHDVDNTGHGASYWSGVNSFSQNSCLCPLSVNNGAFAGFPSYCQPLIIGSLNIQNNYVDPVGINGYPPGNFQNSASLGVTPIPSTSFNGPVNLSGNTSLLTALLPPTWN